MNNLGNINNLDICQLNNSPCPCAAENKTNEIIDIDSPKLTQFLHISKFQGKKNQLSLSKSITTDYAKSKLLVTSFPQIG